jgi:hypothetical protein
MTEDEVEAVAAELAKAGGISGIQEKSKVL